MKIHLCIYFWLFPLYILNINSFLLIVLHVLFLYLWFVCGVFLSFKILVHSNLSMFFLLWIIIFEFSFSSYPLGHFSSKSVKVFFFNKCFQPPGSHICLSCVVPNPFYFLYEFSHHLLNNPSISLWFVMPLLPHIWFCICVSLFLDSCVFWACLSKLYDLLITVTLEKCWCMVIRDISSFYFPLEWSWLYVALLCHLNFRMSL